MYPLDIRQSEEWLEYLEFLGWKILETSGGIKGVMMKSRFGNVIKVQRPRGLSVSDLKDFDKIAEENKIAFVKVEPDLSQDLTILDQAGYITEGSPLTPPTTIFIDLSKDKESLWEDLSGSCKYSIRRAKREGAVTDFYTDPDENLVEKFYEIHKSTGKQKSFYIQSREDIKKKAELFKDRAIIGMVRTESGEVTGTNLYLGFGNGVWYLHGGTTAEGRKTKNGYELYWQSILYLKSLGYKWFDLEGVDDKRFPGFTKNWGGLSHFKEKFGGQRVEFPAPRVKIFNRFLKLISKYSNTPI